MIEEIAGGFWATGHSLRKKVSTEKDLRDWIEGTEEQALAVLREAGFGGSGGDAAEFVDEAELWVRQRPWSTRDAAAVQALRGAFTLRVALTKAQATDPTLVWAAIMQGADASALALAVQGTFDEADRKRRNREARALAAATANKAVADSWRTTGKEIALKMWAENPDVSNADIEREIRTIVRSVPTEGQVLRTIAGWKKER